MFERSIIPALVWLANAFSPMLVRDVAFDKFIVVNLLHPLNAYFPMFSTLEGIDICLTVELL